MLAMLQLVITKVFFHSHKHRSFVQMCDMHVLPFIGLAPSIKQLIPHKT